MILGASIKEGQTLLFLDEIQECPQAIASLRYFKEKMAGLAVIAAGSLFEFAMRHPDFKMPVGRIHFLYLEPLSFAEYLDATGDMVAREERAGETYVWAGQTRVFRVRCGAPVTASAVRFTASTDCVLTQLEFIDDDPDNADNRQDEH